MSNYQKNKKLLEQSHNYNSSMEHDACGVGLIASTNGKKSRKIVEYGIEALKAIWHRGAVDADGKSGDGAGIQIEIAPEFYKEKILATGHTPDDDKRICVGMVFLPRTDYAEQEKCREIIESTLLGEDFYIYGWRQVPINPAVLGKTADRSRPEIAQVMFKKNKEMFAQDIEQRFYLEQSTTSHHLNMLKKAGITKSRKEGRKIFYSIDYDSIKHILDAFNTVLF